MDEVLVNKLKAVAHKTRWQLLNDLITKDYCVKALAKKNNISESAVSQHLKVLREAELVIGEKRGYYVHYSVKRDGLKEIASKIEKLATKEARRCQNCN